MTAWFILIECMILTAGLCGLHLLKKRFSLMPLYMVLGLCEVFLFLGFQLQVRVDLPFGPSAMISYELFLPLLFAGIAMIYVLEGTQEARRLIVALCFLYLAHGIVDYSLAYYSQNPPPGEVFGGDLAALEFSLRKRVASLIAILTDFVVMIVVYQGLRNRLKWLPLAVPFFIAQVLAMVNDGVVFGTLAGFGFGVEDLQLAEKMQAGIAAAIPMSMYLAWQIKHNAAEVHGGVLHRGAFEIVDLRRKVTEIQEKLKEQRAQYAYVKDSFSRYVSPEVVTAIIEDPTRLNLGGEVREVTVLFTDIRGYSTISEVLEPTELITLLNRFFERASRVVTENQGMVNEYEGDAVLAIFGAPLDLPNHRRRAVEAAQQLLEEVEHLNVEWQEDGTLEKLKKAGIDKLSIRIGVHSGSCVAGNIGSRDRIKYAVIGDTVNTASRVEGLNKELSSSLLITEQTYQGLSLETKKEWIDRGEHKVKGRREPVRVYSSEFKPIAS